MVSGRLNGMDALDADATLGASRSLSDGHWEWPVHGLRHPPQGSTTGWYVWTGELTEAPDFFAPWHVAHLVRVVPDFQQLLSLPPGTRFLIAPGHEDVWHDAALLETD